MLVFLFNLFFFCLLRLLAITVTPPAKNTSSGTSTLRVTGTFRFLFVFPWFNTLLFFLDLLFANPRTTHTHALVVVGAEGLYKRDLMSLPDPFAILTVDGEQTKTTESARKTLSPYWGEEFDVYVCTTIWPVHVYLIAAPPPPRLL